MPKSIRKSKLQRCNDRKWIEFKKHRLQLGLLASKVGDSRAGKFFGCHRWTARYWRINIVNKTLKGNPGGFRYLKYGQKRDSILQELIWLNIQKHRDYNIPQLQDLLQEQLGIVIHRSWIERVFRNWGWSWKIPTTTQIQVKLTI